VAADDRRVCLFIEIDRLHYASGFAFAASKTFVFPDYHASAGAFFKGVTGAYLQTGGFPASQAHDRGKAACNASDRMDPYRAFDE